MNLRQNIVAAAFASAICVTGGASAQTLNVITAGDQNMVDYVNNYLAPKLFIINKMR